MQLQVVVRDAPSVPEKRAVMLVDQAGEPLPGQRNVVLEQGAGEVSTVTVTFVIDGRNIKLAL